VFASYQPPKETTVSYTESILNEFVDYVNAHDVALGLEETIQSNVVTEDDRGPFMNIEVWTELSDEEIVKIFAAMGYEVKIETSRNYFDKKNPGRHEITIRIVS
jgi:hypothetical protein